VTVAITPEQVKNQEFPVRLKGYDPELVRSFLAEVAQAYRATIRDQGAQWALANISDDLAAVLRAAHDAADRVIAMAEMQAAEMRTRAEAEAKGIVGDAEGYATKIRDEADDEARRALQVLKRAQGEATSVTRDAEEAKHLLDEAREQAATIVSSAQTEARKVIEGVVPDEEIARRVAETEELHSVAMQRFTDAEQALAKATADAEAVAGRMRQDAEEYAANRRREATEDREKARLVLERSEEKARAVLRQAEEQASAVQRLAEREARSRVQQIHDQMAEIQRAAENEARERVQSILAEAQSRLDALEETERALQDRISAAQREFQSIVHRLVGSNATIDLTDQEPMVVLGGRLDDPLDVFVEELHSERDLPRNGDSGGRVDRLTVQRMVSAAVDRALEHSRA
jgi:DivIVA domain-containing protein